MTICLNTGSCQRTPTSTWPVRSSLGIRMSFPPGLLPEKPAGFAERVMLRQPIAALGELAAKEGEGER